VLSEGNVVFLLDVDNTLLDIADLFDHDLSDFLAASPLGVAATNQERT
jgi:hypothetical protein